jgi:hypothetical protein
MKTKKPKLKITNSEMVKLFSDIIKDQNKKIEKLTIFEEKITKIFDLSYLISLSVPKIENELKRVESRLAEVERQNNYARMLNTGLITKERIRIKLENIKQVEHREISFTPEVMKLKDECFKRFENWADESNEIFDDIVRGDDEKIVRFYQLINSMFFEVGTIYQLYYGALIR